MSRLESSVTRVQQELETTKDKLLKTEKARHVTSVGKDITISSCASILCGCVSQTVHTCTHIHTAPSSGCLSSAGCEGQHPDGPGAG